MTRTHQPPYGLDEEDIQRLLDKALDKEEIVVGSVSRYQRVQAVVAWFARATRLDTVDAHVVHKLANELSYFLATEKVSDMDDAEVMNALGTGQWRLHRNLDTGHEHAWSIERLQSPFNAPRRGASTMWYGRSAIEALRLARAELEM